eukprot:403351248
MSQLGNTQTQFENDAALSEVSDSLRQIENIMKAEQKRRVESNEIMNEYITSYLDQLQQSLNDRVVQQFLMLKSRVETIDGHMTKIERELEKQEVDIKTAINQRKNQIDREITNAENLLRNVKGSYRVQKERLDSEQEVLIKEIQKLLKNDDCIWEQIKVTQVQYRLQKLQNFDQLKEFAEELSEIQELLDQEEDERKQDDQEIVDMLNEICIKMYKRIQDQNQ